MKTLAIIGIILGVIAVVLFILAAVAPKHITVQHTIAIDAPKDEVFDQVRYFKNFSNWSPWLVTDPQQKSFVKGTDGQVGVESHWEGVAEKSKGLQTLTKMELGNSLEIQCDISQPFEAKPVFHYTFQQKGNQTIVTQTFDNDLPIPANIFGLLFNVKASISKVNELGLSRLKSFCEQAVMVQQ